MLTRTLTLALVLVPALLLAQEQPPHVSLEHQHDAALLEAWARDLQQTALQRAQRRRELARQGLGAEVDPQAVERLRALQIEITPEDVARREVPVYDAQANTLRIPEDALATIDDWMALGKRSYLRWRGGALLLANVVARASGFPDWQQAEVEARRLMELAPRVRQDLREHGGLYRLPDETSDVIDEMVWELQGKRWKLRDQVVPNLEALEMTANGAAPLDPAQASSEQLAQSPQAVFEAVKHAAQELVAENLAGDPARLTLVRRQLRDLRLEVVVDPTPRLELDKAAGKLVLSSGLLDAHQRAVLQWTDLPYQPLVGKQRLALLLSEPVAAVAQLPRSQWELQVPQGYDRHTPPPHQVTELIARSPSLSGNDGLIGKRQPRKTLRELLELLANVGRTTEEALQETRSRPRAVSEESLPLPRPLHETQRPSSGRALYAAEILVSTRESSGSLERRDDRGLLAGQELEEKKLRVLRELREQLRQANFLGAGFSARQVRALGLRAEVYPDQHSIDGKDMVYQAQSTMTVLIGGEPRAGLLGGKLRAVDPRSTVELGVSAMAGNGQFTRLTHLRVALSEFQELQTHPGQLRHTALGALLRRAVDQALREGQLSGPREATAAVVFDDVRTVDGRPLAAFSNELAIMISQVLRGGPLSRLADAGAPLPELSEQRADLLQRALLEASRVGDVATFSRVLALRRSTAPLLAEDLAFLRAIVGDAEAAARAEETRTQRLLARFRDPQGRVDWAAVSKAGLFKAGSSTGKFTLAMFLKELGVAVASHDRARLDAFFDFVASTDFYMQYGLFAAGAAAGEGLAKLGEAGARRAGARFLAPRFADAAAYRGFLRRYVKPRFVSGVLRSNVALAAGLALPQLVRGELHGEAFAISFASLGISSALVQGALSRIPWVRRVRAVDALRASKLARLGGWTYQAAELAVVLVASEVLEHWWLERDARAQAVQRLQTAATTFARDSLAAPDAAAREAALQRYLDAWDAYRQFLYAPLFRAQAEFQSRLAGIDRQARLDGGTQAKLEQLITEGRFDSLALQRFAKRHLARASARGEERLQTYADAYQQAFQEGLTRIYQGDPRQGPLSFADLERRLERGERDPGALAQAFAAPHADVSPNRLQTYADQRDALRAAARLLGADLGQARDLVDRLEAADRRLFDSRDGTLVLDAPTPGQGIADRVEGN